MMTNRLLFAVVMFWCGQVCARADEALPLDAEQRQIVRAVNDELIAGIKALKAKHPELARFGEAPEFSPVSGGFRYDYRVENVPVKSHEVPQERALPGGGIIFFRLYSTDGLPRVLTTPGSQPFPPELNDYGTWSSAGGARAGIEHFCMLGFAPASDTLQHEVMDLINHELDTTFARMTGEYNLAQEGIPLDVPSLLAAAADRTPPAENRPFEGISQNAFMVLRSRPLTPAQLARLRQGFREGKYPLRGADSACQIFQEQDGADFPGFLADLAAGSLQAERAGGDTFYLTPFTTFDPWASDAGEARRIVLAHLKDGDARYWPVAALLLTSDTVLDHRLGALDYLARQPGPGARQLILDALGNSYRSVQAYAAKIAADQKLPGAEAGLRALLASPSPKVRSTAVLALQKLGITVSAPPEPPVPDSARQIADGLWGHGLDDDDFLKGHVLTNINAPLWPAFDDASLKKAIGSYTSATPHQPSLPWNHVVPAPFLLAAAFKLHNDEAARTVYGYLCDNDETDDDWSAAAADNLGWDRFAEGLDQFHRGDDAAATASFARVIALADMARPFSLLGIYVKQSRELTDYLKNPPPPAAGREPSPNDTAAYAKYWISRLSECDGSSPSPAGEKLRQLGLTAIPFLLAAAPDRTPTRNFSYGRSYEPARDFVYVGDAALTVLDVIARDYGLDPPRIPQRTVVVTPLLLEKLRAWAAALPADARLLPPEKRPPKLLYPAGRYFWGDD
jgi:hypothetical protein